MGKKKDLTGQRFNRWVVLSETAERSKNGEVRWLCRCDCGNEKVVGTTALTRGESGSCGCYNHDIIKKHDPKYKRKLYSVYHSILSRCNNENDPSYRNYGGRGVRVSEEWNTYEAFEKWAIDNGYKQGLWIDRIDNDGDYEPSNCQWRTPKEQQNNKRSNIKLNINGEVASLTIWAERNGIKPATLSRRIELGWETADLFKPVDLSRSHSAAIKAALRSN